MKYRSMTIIAVSFLAISVGNAAMIYITRDGLNRAAAATPHAGKIALGVDAAFARRSPGARGDGALFQTKNRASIAAGKRIKPRRTPGYPGATSAAPPDIQSWAVVTPPSSSALDSGPTDLLPIATGGAGAGESSPIGIIGGGSGSGGGTIPIIAVPPGPVAAVPEPSAWATFMAGVALLGMAQRRARAHRVSAKDQSR